MGSTGRAVAGGEARWASEGRGARTEDRGVANVGGAPVGQSHLAYPVAAGLVD